MILIIFIWGWYIILNFIDIAMGLVLGEIEQSIVVAISTQDDSAHDAKGTFFPRC